MAIYPEHVYQGYQNQFNNAPKYCFSCGGRFELLGNHTDHNHGLCLAATCDLAISAAVNKRDDNKVIIISEGYESFTVDLDDLEIKPSEVNTSQALTRGIAFYLKDHGYNIGGFDAYMYSDIFRGAGVSTSAAFEVLVGYIFSALYNNNSIPQLTLSIAGQFAEINYFGKACGLLDQIAVGYGEAVSINFKTKIPEIRKIDFPFDDVHFVIVNTGGSHAELSDLYSAVPQDMYNAAHKMGKEYLVDCSREQLEAVKGSLTDMEYSRATHYFNENENVLMGIKALETKDEALFLKAMNSSRESSTKYLKNMMVGDQYEGSPLEACDLAQKITNNQGASKINGGGFAGSIICAIPDAYLSEFLSKMSEKYGEANVKEIYIRPTGPSKTEY